MPVKAAGPDTPHPAYDVTAPLWRVCRDAYDGDTAIKASGDRYVARPSKMTEIEFQAYLDYPTWYAAFARTIDGLTGAGFRVAPTVTETPSIKAILEDATLTGDTLFDVARELLRELLTVGRGGVLVDYTKVGAPVQRPYLRVFLTEQIISWRTENRGGVETLTRVVLSESSERANEWAIEFVPVLTVLDLGDGIGKPAYRMRRFEGSKASDGSMVWLQVGPDIIPLRALQPLTEIPFVFVSPSIDPTKPPLLDLANLNIGALPRARGFPLRGHEDLPPGCGHHWRGSRKDPEVRPRPSAWASRRCHGRNTRIQGLRA